MKKLSFKELMKEIKDVVKKEGYSVDKDNINDYLVEEWEDMALDNKIFGKIELVEEVGEMEGYNSKTYRTFLFVDHGVYIKIKGVYNSYEGLTWDSKPQEVFPQEKTITVYEPKKKK